MMELVRHPLPKTRRHKQAERFARRKTGVMHTSAKPPQFNMWEAPSRWVWWKFYRDDK